MRVTLSCVVRRESLSRDFATWSLYLSVRLKFSDTTLLHYPYTTSLQLKLSAARLTRRGRDLGVISA